VYDARNGHDHDRYVGKITPVDRRCSRAVASAVYERAAGYGDDERRDATDRDE
jgi:hypothetical protein